MNRFLWNMIAIGLSVLLIVACQPVGFQAVSSLDGSPNDSPLDPVDVNDGGGYEDPTVEIPEEKITVELPDLGVTVDLKYDFLVDDICLANRLKIEDRKIKYTVDYFVNDMTSLELDEEKYHESVISVGFDSPVTEEDLHKIVKVDPCVKSITDKVSLKVYKNRSLGTQQLIDHLSLLSHGEAKVFMDRYLSKERKIRVAVIDSGIDLEGESIGPLSSDLEGTDMVEFDDTPQDTLGHGTEVSSLISTKEGNSAGVVSVMGDYVEILPIRLFGSQKSRSISMAEIHRAIKRAVNMGADVINLSFEAVIDKELDGNLEISREDAQTLECPVMIGHSLKQAIDRQAFIVMSAGHATSYEKHISGDNTGQIKLYKVDPSGEFLKNSNGSLQPCEGSARCSARPMPGPIYRMNDNGLNLYGNTSAPSCWARYLKGAVNVASLDASNQISGFSNWGLEGIELATIGEGLKTLTLANQSREQQGTSFSAALTTAAAAMMIGFHKEMKLAAQDPNEWHYSPWYLEDVLLNGSPDAPDLLTGLANTSTEPKIYEDQVMENRLLPESNRGVRRGKLLDLGSLSAYLEGLIGLSYEQRREQQTDNGELGKGHNADDLGQLIGLQVYIEEYLANQKDRMQAQAIAIYDNGSTKVVTNEVTWSTDQTDVRINPAGIAYPQVDFIGTVNLIGEYQGQTGQAKAHVIEGSIITGEASQAPKSLKIDWLPEESACDRMYFRIFSVNDDGDRLDQTGAVSISSDDGGFYVSSRGASWVRPDSALPGKKITVTAFLYGVRATYEFDAPLCTFDIENVRVHMDKVYPGTNGAIPNANKPEDLPRGSIDGLKASFVVPNVEQRMMTYEGCRVDFSENLGYCGYAYPSLGDAHTNPIVRHINRDIGEELGTFNYTYDLPIRWTAEPQTLQYEMMVEVRKPKLESIQIFEYSPSRNFQTGESRVHIYGNFEGGFAEPLRKEEIEVSVKDLQGNDIPKSQGYGYDDYWRFGIFEAVDQQDFTITAVSKESAQITQTMQFSAPLYHHTREVNMPPQTIEAAIKSGNGIALGDSVTVFEDRVVNTRETSVICQDPGVQGLTFASGNGTVANPYVVCNPTQLKNLEGLQSFAAPFVKLGDHIDMAGVNVSQGIGAAEIDGDGYEIRNLVNIQQDVPFPGLYLFKASSIKNLGFRDMLINRDMSIFDTGLVYLKDSYAVDVSLTNAKFIHSNRGFMDSFHVVNAELHGSAGALAMSYYGAWVNSYIDANALGTALYQPTVIRNFYSNGALLEDKENPQVISSAMQNVGNSTYGRKEVPRGYQLAHLNNLYVRSQIRGNGSVGGLVGYMYGGLISNVVVETDIQSQQNRVGGIVGRIGGSGLYARFIGVQDSTVRGIIRGRDQVGGAIGQINSGFVKNITVEAQVVGEKAIGGLIGEKSSGYAIVEGNDMRGVQVTASRPESSDLIGLVNGEESRGHITGPSLNFYSPLVIRNNQTVGNFLNDQQDDLSEALNIILNQQ